MLVMPDGTEVEQGGPEDKATWWTCIRCSFTGPLVGANKFGEAACKGSCGGITDNPDVPRFPGYFETEIKKMDRPFDGAIDADGRLDDLAVGMVMDVLQSSLPPKADLTRHMGHMIRTKAWLGDTVYILFTPRVSVDCTSCDNTGVFIHEERTYPCPVCRGKKRRERGDTEVFMAKVYSYEFFAQNEGLDDIQPPTYGVEIHGIPGVHNRTEEVIYLVEADADEALKRLNTLDPEPFV